MSERREAQLSRQPGFTPVPNKKIDAAIAGEVIQLLDQDAKLRVQREPMLVLQDAMRSVARKLAPRPFGKTLRGPRPSKSDCPIYRKVAIA